MESGQPLFRHCPLTCTSKLETTTIKLPEGFLRQCPDCGQLLSACTAERYQQSMQEFDNPDGTLPARENAKRYEQRMGSILGKATQRLGKGAQDLCLLDVGCSSGALLLVAGNLGLHARGVEPAGKAAETARAFGFEVYNGMLHEAAYDDASFDIVTLFEVIEHLTEPIPLVQEIYRILKPGGVLLIGTANADAWTVKFLGSKWEYFDIDSHGGHVSFFSPQSILKLAQKCSFSVAKIQTRRVNLSERKDVSPLQFELLKICRELLALPARLTGKGHDMLATLIKDN